MPSSVNSKRTNVSRSNKSLWSQLKNTSFGESRSYLFEYGLLLLLTGGLVFIVTAMVQSFYENVFFFLPFVNFNNSDVFLLSALTVVLPLVIILIQRTAESEAAIPALKNLSWRKAFLGIFLAVISIWAVISSILFINSILEYLSNGLLSGEDYNWQSSLRYFVSALILIVTAWSFGNDYRYVARDHFANLRHGYRYGLVILSLVVGLLFLLFPFRDNRTTYADNQIVNDLYAINSQIDSYNTSSGKLPIALTDLTLSGDQLQRSKTYSYSYQATSDNGFKLCANFNKSGSDINSAGYPDTVPNLAIHTSGNNCFDFVVTSAQQQSPSVEGAATDDSTLETTPTTSEDSLY